MKPMTSELEERRDKTVRGRDAGEPNDGPPRFPVSPWLVVLGIVAVVIGMVFGLIMASVGA